jgi:SAM-dependent methyltransferase
MLDVPTVSELKKQYYKNYKSPFSHFNDEVQKIIGEDTIVLHVGCGADESIGLRTRARLTVGIDLDDWILNNSDIDLGILGDISHLPLSNKSIDVIVARWVFEHLRDPYTTFLETARVLRPKGTLIILTPNKYHYSGFITSLVPHRAQKWFVKNLLHGNPSEVFPTYYRANTLKQLRALSINSGLAIEQVQMIEGAPTLLGFSRFTYLIGILFERIVNRANYLSGFRSAILGKFQKI